MQDAIVVRGARTHNLKNIDVAIPATRLVVVTGVSGSGKSSLAFDTLYAEGQRRYVESLSAYARQFLERMEKPDVDRIDGICPAIAIRQKNTSRNPRSTVGTTTEIHDYLRLLYARIGRTFCRNCGREVVRDSAEQAASTLLALPAGTRLLLGFVLPPEEVIAEGGAPLAPGGLPMELAPAGPESIVARLRKKGFARLLIDGRTVPLEEVDAAELGSGPVTVILDRLVVGPDIRSRLTDSLETAFAEGAGSAFGRAADSDQVWAFSERFECRACGIPYEDPQPRLFSFNNPFGACPTCHGFGNIIELDMDLVVPDPSKSILGGAIEPWTKPHYRTCLTDLKRAAKRHNIRLDAPWRDLSEEARTFVLEGDGEYEGIKGFFRWLEGKKYKVHVRVFLSRYRGYLTCPDCEGARLRREAREVQIGGLTIDQVCTKTVREAQRFFAELDLSPRDAAIADKVLREIRKRLVFLADVGLDYLTLDRLSSSLSGGEAQRINLASSLGSSLVGTLYVLDEPSIGLHPRDNHRLITILKQLRDQGNTVLVVEHDAEMMRVADYIIDLGLGAGEQGGRVVFTGPYKDLLSDGRSLTAKYLRNELAIPVPTTRRRGAGPSIRVLGAFEHNLKDIDVSIPLGTLTCVTGVSGSGKSTLVHDVIYAAVKRAKGGWDRKVGSYRRLEGVDLVGDVVLVDQSPIGRTPRSNPVTYLKGFDPIRELFASTKDARGRGLTASHFSFNVPGGRCEACQGEGQVKVEMQFLADVYVPCDQCEGMRFKSHVLDVRYKGRTIHQVLDMTVREALAFFGSSPKVTRRLQVLDAIGLGYLRLGQAATTLSGGEAQRIKIAAHLSTRAGDHLLYILDEPTTGLHFDDIAKLLTAFRKLLQAGHTLLVIEHNLDVIKTADWIIDLGPEGGEDGGYVVAAGTPEDLARHATSHTGRYLQNLLANGRAHAYAAANARGA